MQSIKLFRVFLAISFLLMASAASAVPLADLNSSLVNHVPLTKDTALLVVIAKNEAVAEKKGLTSDAPIDHWFFLGSSYFEHRLIGARLAGMSLVGAISKSPDGKYLAVESGMEGVTVVEIIEVAGLVDEGKYKLIWESSKLMNCQPPGWIKAKKWKGQNLIVEADTWLPNCNEKKLSKNRKFSINAATGKISPL